MIPSVDQLLFFVAIGITIMQIKAMIANTIKIFSLQFLQYIIF